MPPVPRIVIVARPTEYDGLLRRHGTHGQADFFLRTRGQAIDEVLDRHRLQGAAIAAVLAQVPEDWRRAVVTRSDLERYLFEPRDVAVVVGQDGLVANVAKYLDGQPLLGINPDPGTIAGVLVRHAARDAGELMELACAGGAPIEERAMVQAASDDGRRLLCLNEVFVGHRSHQSARYEVDCDGAVEWQSSSGVVVTTGTGATGWGLSIHLGRRASVELPAAHERHLAFFVREPFPGRAGPALVTDGIVGPGGSLGLTSRMDEGGVAFGDGIETDAIELPWGARLEVSVAPEVLRLVA